MHAREVDVTAGRTPASPAVRCWFGSATEDRGEGIHTGSARSRRSRRGGSPGRGRGEIAGTRIPAHEGTTAGCRLPERFRGFHLPSDAPALQFLRRRCARHENPEVRRLPDQGRELDALGPQVRAGPRAVPRFRPLAAAAPETASTPDRVRQAGLHRNEDEPEDMPHPVVRLEPPDRRGELRRAPS